MWRFVFVVALVAAGLVWAPDGRMAPVAAQDATPTAACPATTEAENQAVVQAWYDAINVHDLAAFDAVVAPVVIQHAADFPDATGLEEVKANFTPFLAAFPDIHHQLEQWVTDGDIVVVRGMGSGTHQAPFMGIPATGREVSWTFLSIYRVECGKIAEHWSEVDALGRLQQLGAIALPGAAGTPTGAAADQVETPAPEPSASPAACPTTSEEQNADLVHRWYDEVWSQGDFSHLDDLVAPNHVHHRVLNRLTTGSEARAQPIRGWRKAMPDLMTTAEFMVTDGDQVVARWVATGTQEGPLLGIAPTGKNVTWTGNTIFRIECGRIAEEWSEADSLSFFQQLGVVAEPPAPLPEATPSTE